MKNHARWQQIFIAIGIIMGLCLVAGIILAEFDERSTQLHAIFTVQQERQLLSAHHVIRSRSWSFLYNRNETSSNSNVIILDGVHNGVIYRQTKPYLIINAQRINLNVQTLDFTTVGLVRLQIVNDPYHNTFETDSVVWTNATQLLQMDRPIFLHVNGQTVRIRSISISLNNYRNSEHKHSQPIY